MEQKILRFIRMRDLTGLVGLSRAEVYRRLKIGDFPEPIRLGPRIIVWPSDIVRKWQQEQIQKTYDRQG